MAWTHDRALRYLGLAAKAGKLVLGADECDKAIKAGRGKLLVLAQDAGGNVVRMAKRLSAERGLRLMRTKYTKPELAAALGRGSSVALALVCDEGLAEAFVTAAQNDGMEQEEPI
jgi:ribosomal protein L7Ae-like RNA K-turn-binding protein